MPRMRFFYGLRSVVAVVLTLPVTFCPYDLRAAVDPSVDGGGAVSDVPLKGDEKLLHVLDRFTYGSRPGDLEKLRVMGLQTWFEQQLEPQRIDDSGLEKRLAAYPAMQLPLKKLMELYPNQEAVRKVVNGVSNRPQGEAEKAIYNASIARYKAKLANKKELADDSRRDDSADVTSLPQDAQTLIALPPDKRFSALCKFTPQQVKTLRRSAKPEERLALIEGLNPQQLEAIAAVETPQGVVEAEAIQTKLLRDIYTERQLNEVMVDFWLNHFNVYMHKSQDAPSYVAAYDRDSIRPYALGRFENLLVASATSPAMLNYLDNSSSVGPHSQFAMRPNRTFASQAKKQVGVNENYARELMELHTLGVNGGYTQSDVTEVAKVFTGWTVGSPERGGVPAQAQFDAAKHEPGTKTVLGMVIKENGEREGLQVLHILATSPQTARLISTELAIRFVSDDPLRSVVDRMTHTFLATHGDIRMVLLTMVNSPEFFSHSTYRAKVKTPQDFVISAVRASGADVQSAGALASVISELGMPVYGMQSPNGYSMRADPWNNTASLIARLNFALALSTNRVVGVKTDWTAFLADTPGTAPLDPTAKELSLEWRLLHIAISERTRETIRVQISADPAEQEATLKQVAVKDRKRDPLMTMAIQDAVARGKLADPQAALAAGLLFGSPEFQRR